MIVCFDVAISSGWIRMIRIFSQLLRRLKCLGRFLVLVDACSSQYFMISSRYFCCFEFPISDSIYICGSRTFWVTSRISRSKQAADQDPVCQKSCTYIDHTVDTLQEGLAGYTEGLPRPLLARGPWVENRTCMTIVHRSDIG